VFELSDKVENTPVTATVVLPPVMTEVEARRCVEEINSNINRIRLLLVELESRVTTFPDKVDSLYRTPVVCVYR
jgi:hypothetical protein